LIILGSPTNNSHLKHHSLEKAANNTKKFDVNFKIFRELRNPIGDKNVNLNGKNLQSLNTTLMLTFPLNFRPEKYDSLLNQGQPSNKHP
jgi:hypothetical protein